MTDRRSPYVGLLPYSEADAEVFFGREREQRIIAANLRTSRLTLLYGASGVGKTSVLLAGVLPDLRRTVATHRPAATRPSSGHGSLAVAELPPFAVAVLRDWRDAPLPRLAEAVRAAVIEATGDDDFEPWQPGAPLVDTLSAYTARVRTVLVILDQFEDYFLYRHSEERAPGSFDDQFAAVANKTKLRVHFLLSLREDALSQLDHFKGRISGLFSNYLRVDYLDREAARRAVTEPVEAYNDALGEGIPRSTVTADAVENVLDEVRTGRLSFGEGKASAQSNGAPTADELRNRIETPYLQLVMERLWEAAEQPDGSHVITSQTLSGLGGAKAIVSSHLRDAMLTLSPADEDLAATVFQFLVTPSRTKIAHKPSDLAFFARRPVDDVARVLGQLAGKRRIVRSLPPPPGEREGSYEIFHDVLADAVLEWCARHEAERARAALAEQVREEDRARRKARRDRLLRRLAVILGLVVIALLALLIPACDKERRVRSVGLATAATGQIAVDPERAVLIAREALDAKETDRAREALGSAVAASHVLARMGHRKATRCGAACSPEPSVAGWMPPPAALTTLSFGTVRQQQQASFTSDGRRVVAVVNGEVRIWEPETGDFERVPGITDAQAARVSPDGGSVLVLGVSGAAHVASMTGDDVWPVPGLAKSVALSADGRFVASVSQDKVTVRRVRDEEPLASTASARPVANVEFNPVDPRQLMLASAGSVRLWRWRTSDPRLLVGGAPAHGVPAGVGAIAARFSPDGRSVAAIDTMGRARVVDLAPLERHRRTPGVVSQAIVSPSGDRLLTIEGHTATLRRPETGEVAATLGGHDAAINSAVFSADGRYVATGSSDDTARIWDVASGNQTMELRGHGAAVTDVAFSPDEQQLVTDGEDGTTRLWDVSPGLVLRPGAFTAPLATPRSDGKVAVLDLSDGAVGVWTPGQSRSGRAPGYKGEVVVGAVSPNGELAAVSGDRPGHGLVLLNPSTGASKTLARRPFDVLAFSPDASRLFALRGGASGPPLARAWDTKSRQEASVAQPNLPRKERYDAVVWGPGNRLLLTSPGRPPRIIDAATGDVQELSGPSRSGAQAHTAQGGGFSPAGKLVVTAGARQALVWRTGDAKIRRRLQGHTTSLTTAAFSPDGDWVVTGDEGGAVRVWDPDTARTVVELPAHGARVLGVAFTPDSERVVSSAEDGTVRVYDCVPCRPFAELLGLADIRVTRRLTTGEKRAFLGEAD